MSTTAAIASSHPLPREHQVAHHFPSAKAEAEACKLGMWLFLVTEILLFSGLFCAYAIYRTTHAEMFKDAHHQLNVWLGALNTSVLIGSSLTMALGVRAAQLNQRSRSVFFLLVTLACAATFLVVKFFEYRAKFEHGMLPGIYFSSDHYFRGSAPSLFFGIYFLMTGLHGLHVVAGMIAIIWVTTRTVRGDFSSRYYTPVELTGLYWHLVDLIWIYLFPLLYLVS